MYCLKCIRSRSVFTPLLQVEDSSRFSVTNQFRTSFFFPTMKTLVSNFTLVLLGPILSFSLTLFSPFLVVSGKAYNPCWLSCVFASFSILLVSFNAWMMATKTVALPGYTVMNSYLLLALAPQFVNLPFHGSKTVVIPWSSTNTPLINPSSVVFLR